MISITSSSNSTIKLINSLHRKKERWANKLFIVEGIKMVDECINNGYPIEFIVYSNQLFNVSGGDTLYNKIKDFHKLINVPDKLYNDISDVGTPQGVLAVIGFEINSIDDLADKRNPFILLLDKVQDPGNMGTIIRTADSFGIDGVIVVEGCVDVYNPKVVRSTMGSIFRVPIYHQNNGVNIIKEFKNRKINIYSTSLEGDRYIQDVDFTKSSMLIIGNESKGVSEPLQNLADTLIKIPMLGDAESLNAAVASSIIMYEGLRQRLE